MAPKPCLQQILRSYAWKPLRTAVCRQTVAGAASALRGYHHARVEELEQADALKYPRIQCNDAAAPSMRIPKFREKYEGVQVNAVVEEEVVVHGRIQSVRRAGSKLAFLVIRSEFRDLQAMYNASHFEKETGVEFKDLVKLLNRGDIISVKGKATRTPRGELTLLLTDLPKLLTPSLVPLPFQVLDQNPRFLNRHIDLLTNRKSIDTLRLRSHIIKYMRDFFHERDFLEFQTPILADNAGGAVARPFITAFEGSGKPLAMRIAPELWLKRLVVGGVDRIFELGPSFRNEGIDQTHNPEFTTCEFYHAYAGLDDLIRLTEDLICGAAAHCSRLISSKLDSLPPVDTDGKFARRSFKQLEFIPTLEAALGFTLPDLESPTALEQLNTLLESNGGHSASSLPADQPAPNLPKLLDHLAATHIEPHSLTEPVFITHHPVCMSPLSKSFVCPRTGQHVSARTELFVDGMELANMYEEENDPFAQRHKFVQQATEHRDPDVEREQPVPLAPGHEEGKEGVEEEGKEDDVLIDESFVSALESGLPPTGGWGCGVERLVMLFAGTRRISDCLSFGNVRNVVGVSTLRRPAKWGQQKEYGDEKQGEEEVE